MLIWFLWLLYRRLGLRRRSPGSSVSDQTESNFQTRPGSRRTCRSSGDSSPEKQLYSFSVITFFLHFTEEAGWDCGSSPGIITAPVHQSGASFRDLCGEGWNKHFPERREEAKSGIKPSEREKCTIGTLLRSHSFLLLLLLLLLLCDTRPQGDISYCTNQTLLTRMFTHPHTHTFLKGKSCSAWLVCSASFCDSVLIQYS